MSFFLTENGVSDYRIILSREASPSERLAAREFSAFIEKISGAVLPVCDDTEPETDREVVIGYGARKTVAFGKESREGLGDDGFVIKTEGEKLIIGGGQKRGTLYGVYTFLEDYLGCRWFTPTLEVIPKKPTIRLSDISRCDKPVLEYREPYMWEVSRGGQEWNVRNKCNATAPGIDAEHGGGLVYGTFVHSFLSILPPGKYFEEHPEYFSEIDGKRVGEHSQLCLTNPDVLRLTIETVRRWIAEKPGATIFSVSQNDWGNYCTCPRCRELDEREGSHAGSLIHFVNAVAEAIEKDYPHVSIDTLAYQYTRKAPKYVRPRPNVIVRLCSIECCEVHPIRTCHVSNGGKTPSGYSFAEDLMEWNRVCKRLYIWDYSANFHMYFLPQPNMHCFQDNLQMFVENGVRGVFHEGSDGGKGGGYCAELKAYVLAKLLWDPYCDAARHEWEFLTAYYGQAAYCMKDIFDDLRDSYINSGAHMFFAMAANSTYLWDDGIIVRLYRKFAAAEAAADTPEIAERVFRAKLWLRLLEITRLELDAPGRAETIERWRRDVKSRGFDCMGCAPNWNVDEMCDELLKNRDFHP